MAPAVRERVVICVRAPGVVPWLTGRARRNAKTDSTPLGTLKQYFLSFKLQYVYYMYMYIRLKGILSNRYANAC